MKSASALGILFSTAIFACAPVASSVPKMTPQSPRTRDAITDDSGKFDLRVISRSEVVTRAQAAEKTNALAVEGYDIATYEQNDGEVASLREERGLRDLKLAPTLNRADIVVLFVVKSDAKPIPLTASADLKMEWSRNAKNQFSFEVSPDRDSGAAWSYVKGNLESLMIASREAKAK
jgi:hypothetical protein